MERVAKIRLAKLLYALLFVALLPLLLMLWAHSTRSVVTLPVVLSRKWGILGFAIGVLLIAWAMAALWRRGGGPPMNAFPPPRYVSDGIYSLLRNPIYIGFAMACVGVALASGSPSGLWLVSPTLMMASAALVLGYELPDMKLRFGDAFPENRMFPPSDENPPRVVDRLRCYVTVLLPWFLLYEAIIALGVPIDAKVAYLPFESRLAVWPSTEILYVSTYLVVAAVPLIVRTRRDLRWFSSRGLVSMMIVFPIYLAVPLTAPPRSFASNSVWGWLLNLDRSHDGAAAAFPSYHVIWAFLAAEVIGRNRWQKWSARTWAVLVSASCLTTGMHALVDVLAGFLMVWIIAHIDKVWSLLRSRSEAIANSWHEWRIGSIRVINHGGYAALGIFVGITVLDTLLGPGKELIAFSIFAGGAIGSALWAQWIEGSPSLLRPLGFYGGMIGTAGLGMLAALFCGTSIWIVLSALVVAAPLIQGIGRLRCLVQGCCHGRPTNDHIGIRYLHARSRVYRIESLRGVPVHPTPLYSVLWNVFVALLVTRLYLLHTTTAMVGGVYLILSGVGRFVEEAYRGEPQTRIFGGVRLYQWIAIGTLVVGAFITTLTDTPRTSSPVPHASSFAVAAVCGILAWILTGVDFPESDRRFARLT